MASLKIGSNEDVNEVLVDTGSSDLWVMSHDLNCVPVLNTKRFERSFGQGTGVLPIHKLKNDNSQLLVNLNVNVMLYNLPKQQKKMKKKKKMFTTSYLVLTLPYTLPMAVSLQTFIGTINWIWIRIRFKHLYFIWVI